jgi:CheY-like chemotaxis protein
MNLVIDDESAKMLDAILPYFEFGEVINIKNAIRKVMEHHHHELANTPVSLVADGIKDFLVRHSFAINFTGEALINSRGMALKNAGSLHGFQRNLLKQHDYVVIDDDRINNILCENVIRKVDAIGSIKTFTDPNVGLRYIHEHYGGGEGNEVLLLLDIAMPTLLGWEVLDEFRSFSDVIKNHFKIFMVTSSIDPNDKRRAGRNPLLWGYIEKPLTFAQVQNILLQHKAI